SGRREALDRLDPIQLPLQPHPAARVLDSLRPDQGRPAGRPAHRRPALQRRAGASRRSGVRDRAAPGATGLEQAVKIAPIALAFATASALAGTPETPEITGKVVDAASGRAIPGAVVVAKMGGDGGSMFGHGHFRQLHCTAVRADEQGRFRIPAWTWSGRRSMSLDGYGAHFSAYHPDYTIYTPGGPSGFHHPIRSIPLIGTQLKPSEAVVRMHRFAKDSGNA